MCRRKSRFESSGTVAITKIFVIQAFKIQSFVIIYLIPLRMRIPLRNKILMAVVTDERSFDS